MIIRNLQDAFILITTSVGVVQFAGRSCDGLLPDTSSSWTCDGAATAVPCFFACAFFRRFFLLLLLLINDNNMIDDQIPLL